MKKKIIKELESLGIEVNAEEYGLDLKDFFSNHKNNKKIKILSDIFCAYNKYEYSLLLDTPKKIFKRYYKNFMLADTEEFRLLLLNNNLYLKKDIVFSKGGLTWAYICLGDMVRMALLYNVPKIAAVHFHLQDNYMPSEQDKTITDNIIKAFELVDIELVDHIIISKKGYYSFAEKRGHENV